MIKKILVMLLVGSLFGCGYQPLYLKKKELNYPRKSFELKGDKKINRSIVSLLNLKGKKNAINGYELILDSKKTLEVISKDKKGDPTSIRMTLMVNLLLSGDEKIVKKKQFSEDFTYNNNQNKFELSQYQKNIEMNLINEITEKIFIFLKL